MFLHFKYSIKIVFCRGGDEETEEDEAFRKWFRYIGELRAIFPDAAILALSATCTNKIRKHVTKVLNLRNEHTKFISVSPNKTNIKLLVKRIDNSIETSMYWIIDSLEKMKCDFPNTLIYANSISHVSKLYAYVESELPQCSKHIDMFHSETPDQRKKKIIEDLCQSDSQLRIVFATTALGMGIDVINCHSIVLYGPPRNVLDLIQEVGRIGRDGRKSVAILMHNSYHLRNVSKEVKKVFKETCECRRKSIMQNFLSDQDMHDLEDEFNKHTCCDICSTKCSCGDCEKLEIEKLVENVVYNPSCSSDSDTIGYEVDNQLEIHDEVYFSDDDIYEDLDLIED